ncbi:hypothetical protein [Trichocoleus sp. FACHB-262]|nr:hypothetical protein [Trichocoleus sp. FACHB-262]
MKNIYFNPVCLLNQGFLAELMQKVELDVSIFQLNPSKTLDE